MFENTYCMTVSPKLKQYTAKHQIRSNILLIFDGKRNRNKCMLCESLRFCNIILHPQSILIYHMSLKVRSAFYSHKLIIKHMCKFDTSHYRPRRVQDVGDAFSICSCFLAKSYHTMCCLYLGSQY